MDRTTHGLTGHGSFVGSVSPSQAAPAIDPRARHILSWKNNFPLLLIQEELVVSYWRKKGHLILPGRLAQEQCG